MPDLSLVMLGAGASSRFKMSAKKQWLRTAHDPLWLHSTKNILKYYKFKKIIIVCNRDEIEYMKIFNNQFIYVIGGKTRQESLKNALFHVETKGVLVNDVARVFVSKDMLKRVIFDYKNIDIVVPYLPVFDTVVYKNETINRDEVKLLQTPQLSNTDSLKNALKYVENFTDDSSAIRANGGKVKYVLGDKSANKLTSLNDLYIIKSLQKPSSDIFTGNGYDVHQFQSGKKMFLCGVQIDDNRGFKAHSDGDVAIHALIDSILGASGAGDIGELFPDSDMQNKDIDSKVLLQKVVHFIHSVGFLIVNCDITIIAQTPKLSNYKQDMREVIAKILKIKPLHVNIKATTTEGLGFVGKNEGIAVSATSSLKYFNWKDEEVENENFNSRK